MCYKESCKNKNYPEYIICKDIQDSNPNLVVAYQVQRFQGKGRECGESPEEPYKKKGPDIPRHGGIFP